MLTEAEVVLEIHRATAVHGKFPVDNVRAHLLLSEEVGEVARAVAEVTRLPRLGEKRPSHLNNLREELVQVVAVCSMWITNLDLERRRDEQANINSAGGAVGKRGEGDGGGGVVRKAGS